MLSRVKNGRFAKKKNVSKINKALAAMANAKKKGVRTILDQKAPTQTPNQKSVVSAVNVVEDTQSNIPDENGIISFRELAKNLKCTNCRSLLDMEKLTEFNRQGLHVKFTVRCDSCDKSNIVNTGAMKNNVSDINTSVILGAVHAGVGNTGLNKILACANLPRISDYMYKQYENIVGQAIESEAKDSCKRAAEEEKKLVIENVKKLCDTLSPDIAQDIFPQLDILTTSFNAENPSFDTALGEIINIIVSFDMGWSKRGNGRSYDSLNGYSTIIGFLSGKILDYATRNRKCRKCDLGYDKKDHDCRLNFYGSAKAMERDAGVQLINQSKISKETGLQVRVIIGDEDSSMIAAVRADEPDKKFHKLADKNHLAKNFSNELYKMRTAFSELNKKAAIPHIKKCFTYAVSQNKGRPTDLADNLNKIPDHVFGRHENCGAWCKSSKKHTLQFKDEALYEELVKLFAKYSSNAHKFSIAASSQANESFNNIVANKAHKNKCLSTSAACDIRVADAVCSKNDGEASILNIKKKMNIPIGSCTLEYVERTDSKRLKRVEQSQTKAKKIRRIKLKKKRELLRKKSEKVEGVTYESNCGMNTLAIKRNETIDPNEFPTKIVYFDIETTGLSADAHILQIGAVCGEKIFNVYIDTKKNISSAASKVTKLSHKCGQLFYKNKEVETLRISDALKSFEHFLWNSSEDKEKCMLVAHNARFDVPRFLQAIINVDVPEVLKKIAGFVDTLELFRKNMPNRKGPGQFKLEALAKEFLESSDNQQSFHNAVDDVIILQTLTKKLQLESKLAQFYKSSDDYLERLSASNKIISNLQFVSELHAIISMNMCKKLALHNITFNNLINLYNKEGEGAIIKLFTEKVDDKTVRITKRKDIITKVIQFLKKKTAK